MTSTHPWNSLEPVEVGTRAKFFHPRAMGVMHWGTVREISRTGRVRVQFEICGRTLWTCPDNN